MMWKEQGNICRAHYNQVVLKVFEGVVGASADHPDFPMFYSDRFKLFRCKSEEP
jgi:hypothetical protein